MTAGSVKVRQTQRGVTIRATGAAAMVLAAAVRSTIDAAPGEPYTTIHFRDVGQDVLEWDLDRHQVVTDSRPYQAPIWKGTAVLGEVVPGRKLVFQHPQDGVPHVCNFDVASVTRGLR